MLASSLLSTLQGVLFFALVLEHEHTQAHGIAYRSHAVQSTSMCHTNTVEDDVQSLLGKHARTHTHTHTRTETHTESFAVTVSRETMMLLTSQVCMLQESPCSSLTHGKHAPTHKESFYRRWVLSSSHNTCLSRKHDAAHPSQVCILQSRLLTQHGCLLHETGVVFRPAFLQALLLSYRR